MVVLGCAGFALVVVVVVKLLFVIVCGLGEVDDV